MFSIKLVNPPPFKKIVFVHLKGGCFYQKAHQPINNWQRFSELVASTMRR